MKFDYIKYYPFANSNLSIYEEFFLKLSFGIFQTDIVLLVLIIKQEKKNLILFRITPTKSNATQSQKHSEAGL